MSNQPKPKASPSYKKRIEALYSRRRVHLMCLVFFAFGALLTLTLVNFFLRQPL